MSFPKVSKADRTHGGSGNIGPFPKNTTYRENPVSQQTSVAILAGKKAALNVLAHGKPAVSSSVRRKAEDVSRVMPEQTKQALRNGSRLRNAIVR